MSTSSLLHVLSIVCIWISSLRWVYSSANPLTMLFTTRECWSLQEQDHASFSVVRRVHHFSTLIFLHRCWSLHQFALLFLFPHLHVNYMSFRCFELLLLHLLRVRKFSLPQHGLPKSQLMDENAFTVIASTILLLSIHLMPWWLATVFHLIAPLKPQKSTVILNLLLNPPTRKIVTRRICYTFKSCMCLPLDHKMINGEGWLLFKLSF